MSDQQIEVKRRPFHPLVFLNLITAVAIGIWLPVRIVFFDRLPKLDAAVDIFLLGLVAARLLSFDSSFTERRDAKKRPTLRRYCSLAADVITAVPFVSILLAMGTGAEYFFVVKLLFLRRILDVRQVLDSFDLHPAMTRLLPMALVVPTMIHAIACGWVGLGSGTSGPHEDKTFEYGRAVYWAITTLCTVGYGDIAGRTLAQMFYANGVMIVGVAFFGYVLSNVASLVARLDAAREEYLTLLDKVEGFMRYNDVPTALRAKVRAYYRYLWESRRGYEDASILRDLPQQLRVEIALHLNSEIIRKVPILRGADRDFLQDIVLQFKPLVMIPGERIFRAGEPGDAMYFIHRGTVQIVSSEGNLLATLTPGAFFGEMALLKSIPRNATAQAVDYCEVSVLSRQAFETVLARYPDFESHVKDIAAERERGKNT